MSPRDVAGHPELRRRAGAAGFSLIELLVVCGIVAVLVALLLPSLNRARHHARLVQCQSNLRQIHAAVMMYAQQNRDRFPPKATLGDYGFRMMPGRVTPNDPGALPEVFGLAAVLHGIMPHDDLSTSIPTPPKFLDGRSGVWVCLGAVEWMQEYGNTYAFSIAPKIAGATSITRVKSPDEVYVWDNYTMYPGLSGFRGPFSGYTVPTAQRPLPHGLAKNRKGIVCELRVGGYVTMRVFD